MKHFKDIVSFLSELGPAKRALLDVAQRFRIDHVPKRWEFRIYSLLKKHDLLRRYSPEDILEHLERANMLKIGDEWRMSEIPKKSRKIFEDLGLYIM